MLFVNWTMVPLSLDFNSPGDYFLYLFHILFGLSATLMAGSVVIAILRTEALRIQNRFIFMLNTSISDTLSGVSVFYLCLFDVQVGFPSRNGTFYILTSLLGVNILTFLFAQFDRYFAVCHPFIYGRFVTIHLVVFANVWSWCQVYMQLLLQHLVPLSKAVEVQVFSLISLQVVVLTQISMTVKLLFVARYQLEREPPSAEKESKKESLLIIVLSVVCFLLFWYPSILNMVIKGVTRYGLRFWNEAVNPFSILSRCSVLFTPAIYVWASPALKAAVWKTVWGKVFSKRRKRIDSLGGKDAHGVNFNTGDPHSRPKRKNTIHSTTLSHDV